MTVSTVEITALEVRSLRVPLREPFVIASCAIEATDAVEVALTIRVGDCSFTGLGECATLPPVTRESSAEVRQALLGLGLAGAVVARTAAGLAPVASSLGPVARAGLETAWLDALARAEGVGLARLLQREVVEAAPLVLEHESDVTIPIALPERMAALAGSWVASGFRLLKVKVGRSLADDVAAIEAIVRAAPEASLRLDANGGLDADSALLLLEKARGFGARIELFEQPCAAHDLEGMAELVRRGRVPVVADESCVEPEDVDRLADAGACTGVNLKLVKNGGLLASAAVARRARARGLTLMAGAMVETRLGLSAMLHLVAALGGVEHVDLDTALLLAHDPYRGGYAEDLPTLRVLLDTEGSFVVRAALQDVCGASREPAAE